MARVRVEPVQTDRQRRGAAGEGLAADYLTSLGWQVLARNVRVDRDEIDLLCLDPEPPPELVVVEVRSLRTAAFGAPEERVDRQKVSRLYRAAFGLRAGGRLLEGVSVPRLPVRVDLVVVDGRGRGVELRHLRRLEPP